MNLRYTIIINWSNDDNCYVASCPDFGKYVTAHGDSYEEALKNMEEVLEECIRIKKEKGEEIPVPSLKVNVA